MPRIVRIETSLVNLEPKVQRTDAIQSFVRQETPVVRVFDEEGASGIGYSYTIGTGGPSVMALIDQTFSPALLGRDADQIEAVWRDLFFLTHATTVGAITSIALAAIDTALWDLRCKRAGLPLYLMAGGARPQVPLYSTEGGWLHLDIGQLVEDAGRVKEQGFSGAKVKVGRPLHEDLARIQAVREEVGLSFEIFTDANQAFAIDEAVRRAAAYEELQIGWLEEPLPADDIEGHARLSRLTRTPIAVGESIYSLPTFRSYLQQDACSIIQVDVGRIGGITPWLKTAHLAESFNVAVCPHFLMELHVSLACAVPNARWVEYIPQLDDVTECGLEIKDGHARPSQQPGIGIRWDETALKKFSVAAAVHDGRSQ